MDTTIDSKMTIELDIVERRNEENLKMTKRMEDTMKMIIRGENEIIAPIAASIDDDFDANTTNSGSIAAQSEIQRFYAGKNVFITGGTGERFFFLFASFNTHSTETKSGFRFATTHTTY